MAGTPALLNSQSWQGKFTALHIAAHEGHIDLVRSLVTHDDINLEIQDSSGNTPLENAALAGHVDIVSLLLDHSANPQLPDHESPILVLAAKANNMDMVKAILQPSNPSERRATVDVNAGKTLALHEAIRHRNLDMVKLLITHGADPNKSDKGFWQSPAIFHAVQASSLPILTYIIESTQANIHLRTSSGQTVLHTAIPRGEPDIVMCLLEHGVSPRAKAGYYSRTPFYSCAEYACNEAAKLMIAKGGDVNDDNDLFSGRSALREAIFKHNQDLALIFLEAGADATFQLRSSIPSDTSVHAAIRTKSLRVLEWMVSHSIITSKPTEETRNVIHVDHSDKVSGSLLEMALTYSFWEGVDLLLTLEPAVASDRVVIAAIAGNASVELVQALVDKGAAVRPFTLGRAEERKLEDVATLLRSVLAGGNVNSEQLK